MNSTGMSAKKDAAYSKRVLLYKRYRNALIWCEKLTHRIITNKYTCLTKYGVWGFSRVPCKK